MRVNTLFQSGSIGPPRDMIDVVMADVPEEPIFYPVVLTDTVSIATTGIATFVSKPAAKYLVTGMKLTTDGVERTMTIGAGMVTLLPVPAVAIAATIDWFISGPGDYKDDGEFGGGEFWIEISDITGGTTVEYVTSRGTHRTATPVAVGDAIKAGGINLLCRAVKWESTITSFRAIFLG